MWWYTVISQFLGTQSFLNLVEYSRISTCSFSLFWIWWDKFISQISGTQSFLYWVEHSHVSIWWSTVISQFSHCLQSVLETETNDHQPLQSNSNQYERPCPAWVLVLTIKLTLFYDLIIDSVFSNFVIDVHCRCLQILWQNAKN